MKELIISHSLPSEKNLIISGHGNTVKYFGKNFSSDYYKDSLSLEEGGFIVLQKDVRKKKLKSSINLKNLNHLQMHCIN